MRSGRTHGGPFVEAGKPGRELRPGPAPIQIREPEIEIAERASERYRAQINILARFPSCGFELVERPHDSGALAFLRACIDEGLRPPYGFAHISDACVEDAVRQGMLLQDPPA